jgi:hypothetical protein
MKNLPLNQALAVAVKAARAAGKVMRDNWLKPRSSSKKFYARRSRKFRCSARRAIPAT